jgi:hypothetical protein
MSDAEKLIARAHQELKAAMRASDLRARRVHLELADAYSFRLRETQREERRSQIRLVRESPPERSCFF